MLCTLAGYAFARFGQGNRVHPVLLQLMIMPDVLIVENYRTMSRLGIPTRFPPSACPTWLPPLEFSPRQTFKTVPRELTKPRVEGANPLQILWKVYVPARPVYSPTDW